MRIAQALKEKLMDVRLRDKLIAEGKVTKEEAEKYMADLPDETNRLVYTEQIEKKAVIESVANSDREGLDQ
jgi:polyhydroxyalkanoate synthesis regulator phasin